MNSEKNGSKIVSQGKTTCACGAGCNCGCGSAWRILRWIVGFLILVAAFCIGVKIGEIRAEFHDMYRAYYLHNARMQGGYGGMMVPPTAGYPSSTTPSGTGIGL